LTEKGWAGNIGQIMGEEMTVNSKDWIFEKNSEKAYFPRKLMIGTIR
jgi:hypothetical protein